ncbi:MAG: hypothetical protein IJ635_09670 [Bacteroidaceae bacterium]|nr:hypothetical protein [Bacteroidaceae bacterium]
MAYSFTTLIVFAVALLNVTANLVCGILLLWKRKEVPDRSRTILALPLLLAVRLRQPRTDAG